MARVIIDKAEYRMTDAGLEFLGIVHFEQWEALGDAIGRMNRGVRWALGDWFRYGEGRAEWGDKYTQAIGTTGMDYQTVANCRWVASRIDISRRRENLSWSHHETVARMEPDRQDSWLARAEAEGWTVAELRRMVAAEQPVPGERGRERKDVDTQPAPMAMLEAAKNAFLRLTEGQRDSFREWLESLHAK